MKYLLYITKDFSFFTETLSPIRSDDILTAKARTLLPLVLINTKDSACTFGTPSSLHASAVSFLLYC